MFSKKLGIRHVGNSLEKMPVEMKGKGEEGV